SHFRALSALTDAHLVTHVRNRENLLKAGLEEGTGFTALDSARADDFAHRVSVMLGVPFGTNKGWTTLTALSVVSYRYFEQLVWRALGGRIRAREFDLVHRLTPLSPVVPSLLADRCAAAGVPFVLGPLNGGLPWPREFAHLRAREKEWLAYVRGAYRWLPGYRSTRAGAAAIIVASRATRAEVPSRYDA